MDLNTPIIKKCKLKNGSTIDISDVGLYYGCLQELIDGVKTVEDLEIIIIQFENFQAYELCVALKQAISDFNDGVLIVNDNKQE